MWALLSSGLDAPTNKACETPPQPQLPPYQDAPAAGMKRLEAAHQVLLVRSSVSASGVVRGDPIERATFVGRVALGGGRAVLETSVATVLQGRSSIEVLP